MAPLGDPFAGAEIRNLVYINVLSRFSALSER